jgi:hypothetical protein
MLLDDTRDTIYVHDIDHDLAESHAQQDTISILPGVAGTLLSIPKTLFADTKSQSNELVLYQEPKSLSIPEEQDNVRRAIAETRARARQASLDFSSATESTVKSGFEIIEEKTRNHDDGEDVMDIDPVL